MSSPGSVDAGASATVLHQLLAARLDYSFGEPTLLTLALTHRSWCAEHEGHEPNERLEFLGDAVLGLAVAEHAYGVSPELTEGQMAKVRATVVSSPTLAEVARGLGLGDCVRLGKGEDASGGRDKPSILADAMEAIIGAVYLDGGWPAAQGLVRRLFGEAIEVASQGPGVDDHKTRLQEYVARRYDEPPTYELREEGPDHDKLFHARVLIGGECWGEGSGSSKKQAEQHAASIAWAARSVELLGPSQSPAEPDRSP
jgi:ribonuclease III